MGKQPMEDITPPARREEPASNRVRVALPHYRPRWTLVLLGINGLVWLVMTVMGGSTSTRVLILFGAKVDPLIAAGQYWRLLTACFLHIGLVHLAVNSYSLYSIGSHVESRYGYGRFTVLYLLAGIAGNVLSYAASDSLSAGASGAIFGLLGATISYYVVHRGEFGQRGRRQLTNLVGVAALNLVWGMTMPGIDNLGHIGGLLGGLWLGWAFCPRYRVVYSLDTLPPYQVVDEASRVRGIVSVAALILLMVLLVMLGTRLTV